LDAALAFVATDRILLLLSGNSQTLARATEAGSNRTAHTPPQALARCERHCCTNDDNGGVRICCDETETWRAPCARTPRADALGFAARKIKNKTGYQFAIPHVTLVGSHS